MTFNSYLSAQVAMVIVRYLNILSNIFGIKDMIFWTLTNDALFLCTNISKNSHTYKINLYYNYAKKQWTTDFSLM